MVLVNGVKYACERCIRGHRVTTCTHTDQPLMMIKPKGRPSTACEHCKNARKSKNQHQKCICVNRLPGQPHENGCGCKDDDTCSCQKHRRKTNTIHTPLKKQNSVKKKLENGSGNNGSSSADLNLFQRSTIHNLETSSNNGTSSATTPLDTTNLPQAFDMSLSTGGSMSSEYFIPNVNSTTSITSLPQGRIGMEYLQDFKPSGSVSSRLGEVTVPIDEYVQPFQQMTTNFNNLLSTTSSVKKEEATEGSTSATNNINGNYYRTPLDDNTDDIFNDIPVPFQGKNGLLDLFDDNSLMTQLNESNASINTTGAQPPASYSTSNGQIPHNQGYPQQHHYPQQQSQHQQQQQHQHQHQQQRSDLSPSSNDMFPLFQVVGSASSSAASISSNSSIHEFQTNSPSHAGGSNNNNNNSNNSSHHLHHQYHQLPPHHSSSQQSQHQHGHYNAHFSPYPVPNRSESFLSIASSNASEFQYGQRHAAPQGLHNQSTDSLVSLQHQQTLTLDELEKKKTLQGPDVKDEIDFGLFDSIDSSLSQQQLADNAAASNSNNINGANGIDSFLEKVEFDDGKL